MVTMAFECKLYHSLFLYNFTHSSLGGWLIRAVGMITPCIYQRTSFIQTGFIPDLLYIVVYICSRSFIKLVESFCI